MKRIAFSLVMLAMLSQLDARGDTVTISGGVSGENNTLISGGAGNSDFGTDSAIELGSDFEGDDVRSILRFDLSSVAGYSIENALLQVTLQSTSGSFSNETVYLYQISEANAGWTPGEGDGYPSSGSSAWNDLSDPGVPWAGSPGLSTPGTDYVATPLGTISVNSTDSVGTTYTFALADTSYMAGWASNPATNAGFLLVAPGLEGIPNANINFNSCDAGSGQPDLLAAVPEPGSCASLVAGLALTCRAFRRRRRGE